MKEIKAALRRAVYSLGLAHQWYRLRNAIRPAAETPPHTDESRTPIPPTALINLVVGDITWAQFLDSGEKALGVFADAVDRNGGDFSNAERILDFGCGAGRLARHVPAISSAALTGVDYNRTLVDWCAANLQGDFRRNELRPPLDFPQSHFDVIYLLSVFTHLRQATQNEWLAELARIARPGGFVVITFHDEDHPNLTACGYAPAALHEHGFLIHEDTAEGSNLIGVFQSREFVRRQFGAFFDVAEIVPTPESGVGQAYAVLRRAR